MLAGLPGNESAFSQITIKPLDPEDPKNDDCRGANDPEDYEPNEDLRIYVDTLPGRTASRYFYRASYVDDAQNRSYLSLSGPPVYMPKVTPPRTPMITKILSGDKEITLHWNCNREPSLAEYRIYRTDKKESARDIRLMTEVHRLAASEVSWSDRVPGFVTYYYRVIAMDNASNTSRPSLTISGRAFDQDPPQKPTWQWIIWIKVDDVGKEYLWEESPETALPVVALKWSSVKSEWSYIVQRKDVSSTHWQSISRWLKGGDSYLDRNVAQDKDYEYRIKVKNLIGKVEISRIYTLYRVPKTADEEGIP